MACLWINDSTIIAGGHDNKPYKFEYQSEVVKLVKCIDEGKSEEKNQNVSAMNKFKNLDKFAQTTSSKVTINSIHKNSIK